MPESPKESAATNAKWLVLALSTASFMLLFAVWLMIGILGVKIRTELGISPAQLDWLAATAILAGSLPRLHFGIWTERLGGRLMMAALLLFVAVPTWWFSRATTYGEMLACSALFGLAGNSFTIGVSWNSAWFPQGRKGTALGVFGAGNMGASATKLCAPLMVSLVPASGLADGWFPGGWRAVPFLYSLALVAMALAVLVLAPGPDPVPGKGKAPGNAWRPLGQIRVWRFSLYYVVVFGAYVALVAWLPRYFTDVHGVGLAMAGFLTAMFIFPTSLMRPLGGLLSDFFGPRIVTYWVLSVMALALLPLAIPPIAMKLGPWSATFLIVVLGCCMGIGMASVFKYIPDYFPRDVGAVGGLVGMLGALGGFVLTPAMGAASRLTGRPEAAFAILLVITLASLAWLHVTVLGLRALAAAENQESVAPATP